MDFRGSLPWPRIGATGAELCDNAGVQGPEHVPATDAGPSTSMLTRCWAPVAPFLLLLLRALWRCAYTRPTLMSTVCLCPHLCTCELLHERGATLGNESGRVGVACLAPPPGPWHQFRMPGRPLRHKRPIDPRSAARAAPGRPPVDRLHVSNTLGWDRVAQASIFVQPPSPKQADFCPPTTRGACRHGIQCDVIPCRGLIASLGRAR